MQIVNGRLQLHLRNADGVLDVFHLQNLSELNTPQLRDMDPEMRREATALLQNLEGSPAYAADLATAGQELLRQQAERRAKKKSLVVEVVPQRREE